MFDPVRPAEAGIRANLGQFALLVGINALVGGMVGQERALLPLLADEAFGLATATTALSFLLTFGLAKAITNLAAGALADRYGRRRVLVVGWLLGVPVPVALIAAPDWGWILAANALLGVNQGLTWSMTVLMKIDLAGPRRRGLALGLNEASGYAAVAVGAFATGYVADVAGLRPAPFLLGLAIAGLGLTASVLFVRETRGRVGVEAAGAAGVRPTPWRRMAWRTSAGDRTLSAASQAGFVTNLNDGLAWGLLPIVQAGAGLSLSEIGVLAGAYPLTWGLSQVATGALSDRLGRKRLIVAGMLVQGAAIAAIALSQGFAAWLTAAVALGLGTAMAYPTLLAVVADGASPQDRGAALGVYRFWRDLGLAGGALLIGFVADAAGPVGAIWLVAALTAGSGVVVALRMRESLPAA